MDEVIISKFSAFYYAKIIGFGLIVAAYVAGFVYQDIFNSVLAAVNTLAIIVICIVLLLIYFYSLLRICKRITLTGGGMRINYLIFKKQLDVSYYDIVSANTYRRKVDDGLNNVYSMINYQSLVIEFKNGKSISLSAGDYNNYDELKTAIYKYKYGIG